MIYLKCILAGIAAVLLSVLLLILLLAAWQYFLVFRTSGSGGIGAVSGGLDMLAALVLVGVIFAGGFYWQFRRSSAKR